MREAPLLPKYSAREYRSPWTMLHIIDHVWWAQETSEARRLALDDAASHHTVG